MALNETIFLTGFPGFIAGRLVKRLAAEGARFLLLVQPAFMERAREEVARIAAEANSSADHFQLIEGDITQTDLGIQPLELERVRASATIVFHLAAIYDLAVRRDVAMRVNFEGTRNVNQFALTLSNLRRYHYVSTCYVAGLRTGVILETELRHEAGFRNFYEETKYKAELEVDALKGRLPVTIHRPAVVCGDSRTGETAKYDGIYYLIHYLRKRPSLLSMINIGNRNVSLNLVPVDFVVEAMTALVFDERAAGATVQLADPNPLTTHELFEAIARALAGRGSRLTVPATLVRSSLGLPLAPAITGLPHAGVPYFFLNQTYDTTRAGELLSTHNVRCPPFTEYVSALIEYVSRHPKL
ncbi:MAG TPA: SDR family oxidoreductase [Pyrinomonadaceae bacterium]|nr:SDR family oxidoreductase [Pyrinomonadaceae bacterium]